ncbi:spore coat protein F [Scopulibacillus daqui]|uniref:Spore coat protein F n=1 Tax=Scopulibacillus daqui TaxID=1469162 RepID=A0ABS2Q1Z7_9BACL|nr:spore coat protein [Scopulibacillus daqui]MBM7646299.1 spore coat protein F [Scopulibacillus daqui]
MRETRPNQLAWHETLEIHELVAFQSVNLMRFKHAAPEVKDRMLQALYFQTIKDLEQNIVDLLQYYPKAQEAGERGDSYRELDEGYYAGSLLGFAKSSVKNYAAAITETATPQLKNLLANHLTKAIQCHTKIFNYMYERGMYPAYNLDRLLKHDREMAERALRFRN